MPKSMVLSAIVALAIVGCSRPESHLSANKQLVQRYFEEIINQGRFGVADELVGSDVRFTNPPTVLRTREEFKQWSRPCARVSRTSTFGSTM
jgi:hypothetical protein